MDLRHYFQLTLAVLLTSVACVGQRARQVEAVSDLNRGLVGRWMFDTGSGTSAFDSSGNNNTGTLSGSTLPVWTNGVFGGAVYLPVTNSYVALGSPFAKGQTTISVSVWIRCSTNANPGGNPAILVENTSAASGTTRFGLLLTATNSVLVFGRVAAQEPSGTSTGRYTGSTIPKDTWTHLCGVWNGSDTTITIYTNGIAAGTSALGAGTAGAFANTNPGVTPGQFMGGVNTFPPFIGTIDDVRIWNRALTSTEILNLWAAGAGR